ncbi:MAG TPA: YbgC/FadM family acyl-CoA thioesterase [Sulfuricurvum sp.]|nr:MAG: acyl-CoA thioester hydrolase [Campylobacterales bacterium 16-40-21]OZA03575.1 MAG: acyl-CoA thioester hydrolase [Sulfuricurvum sp. 17-40-25]HQS65912.1 YbgC/FadM family acyl-CoA thioesterase [Sulfuricurvum sp.]HQT35850.1 YbgC/FadM family acyl-CoA thioesterase [Sulfuricurvum sp.]
MNIRVYYEDTDVGGVVYHSNYLNFCERARSQLFFDAGRSPILENGHFVAKHVDANYIKSAKFGDVVDVKTTLVTLKNASFSLLQQIYRGEEKLFEMTIVLVYLDFEGTMSKIPSSEKEFLSSI